MYKKTYQSFTKRSQMFLLFLTIKQCVAKEMNCFFVQLFALTGLIDAVCSYWMFKLFNKLSFVYYSSVVGRAARTETGLCLSFETMTVRNKLKKYIFFVNKQCYFYLKWKRYMFGCSSGGEGGEASSRPPSPLFAALRMLRLRSRLINF